MNSTLTQTHASPKQLNFLTRLLDEATEMLRERDGLTGRSEAEGIIENHIFPMRPDASSLKAEVSQDIDTAMDNNRQLRRQIATLKETGRALGDLPEAKDEPAEFVTEGMYQADGRIYKVLPSRSGNGRHYAKELVGESETGYTFVYAKGAMYRIRPEHRMTAEQAAEWGRLTGTCVCCGALLTDPKSVRDGIGPVCAKKHF